MSGISVLISVLDKLEELNIAAADADGFFNLYPSYLPTIHEDQLLDMMLNHRDRGFIECSVKFHPQWKTIGRTNTNCLGRPIYFKIKLLEIFQEYYSKIKGEHIEDNKPSNNIICSIKYNEYTSEISCEGKVLANPRFDSINGEFFRYIYKNPNKTIKIEDMKLSTNKNPHKIIEQLGFKGKLRQIFFDVNKTTVLFRNPVFLDSKNELGL